MHTTAGARGLFLRLGWQNLGRRPGRTLALVAAVALSTAAVFAALTVRRAVQEGTTLGLSRLGADLLVVPRDTLVNLTPALLTVKPTPHTLPADLAEWVANLPGVERVAPQCHFLVPVSAGAHRLDVDVIAFDPARDFTVLPWLEEHAGRPLRDGDVILGARCEEPLGSQVLLAGQTLTVYGRLGLTGVGPFDRGRFISLATARALADSGVGPDGLADDPSRFSALLVRLAVGATDEQVRFAVARRPEVKVVAGTSLLTSVRQALTATLGGSLFFAVLMLLTTVLLSASAKGF